EHARLADRPPYHAHERAAYGTLPRGRAPAAARHSAHLPRRHHRLPAESARRPHVRAEDRGGQRLNVLDRFTPRGGDDGDAWTREVVHRVQADGTCMGLPIARRAQGFNGAFTLNRLVATGISVVVPPLWLQTSSAGRGPGP